MNVKRDMVLDSLKGFFLVIMAINHFGGNIRAITWETFGFVTMAEGFVFISGYVFSYVYYRYQENFHRIRQRSYTRAKQLLFWQIGMLLMVAGLIVLGERWSVETWVRYGEDFQIRPLVMCVLAIFQIYWPYLFCDVLPLYFFMLLLAPYVFRCLIKEKWLLIGVFSLLGWGLAQMNLRLSFWGVLPKALLDHKATFDLLAWQVLFVGGIATGLLVRQGRNRFFKRRDILYIAIVLSLFGFLLRHQWLPCQSHILVQWTGRRVLALGRLLNFVALSYVLAWVLRRWPFMKNRWLAFLGRHSLVVFVFHAAILHLFMPLRWKYIPAHSTLEWAVRILFVASLTLPAWLEEGLKQRRSNLRLFSAR